jgi:peptidoglycan hydrolase-like protein with peptidoglycan-binding domain
MSETVSRGREAGQQAETRIAAEARGRRGRGRWLALGTVVVLAAGVVWAWRAGVFSSTATPGAGVQGGPPPATAAVTRRDLSAVMPVTATLGYARSFSVTGQGSGTLTWLPAAGTVIRQGQVLYKTDNGSPVVLLYGSVPDWRALSVGMTGQDVAQLNHDLVRLGYATRADIVALGWDYYSWETACAVQRLEQHLGVSFPSGSLTLGQVVFKPEALRVSQVTGSLGDSAARQVLTATSNRHVVRISLNASAQSQVKAGEKVTVTLPDGAATPGVVSWVGTVATTTSGGGGNPGATIPVQVKLTHPRAAGTLDQAPVTVNIITSTVHDVLVVPVTAPLAQASGGYVVEVMGPGNTRRYVPVTVGPIFDDADGLVQVAGALVPGQRVVVAS